MHILATTFKILTVCGCWRPLVYSSLYQKVFYISYAIFVILLVHTFMITQLLDIMINVKNSEDFIDNSYTLMAMMIACCKMVSLLMNRENIIILEKKFLEDPFQTINSEEIEIQNRFEETIRSGTVRYAILIETTAMAFNLTSYFFDYRRNVLTFRAWLPFNYSSSSIFFFTYIHQLIGWTAGSLLHVATDALICGFLMHTCCQFELFESRLKRITNDRAEELRKCVCHHDQIYQFASRINETFRTMIFVQFLVSTLIVCLNLCQLVKMKDYSSSKMIETSLYMSCMLTQIFLYCWCGNEVKLKSLGVSTTIFGSDWTSLEKDARRALIMIMRRAESPIEFTSAYIITMNLDSFVGILKASYSAFNLLQRSQ